MIKPIPEPRLFVRKPVRLQLKIRRKESSVSKESLASVSTAIFKPTSSLKSLIKQYPQRTPTRALFHCQSTRKSMESSSEWSGNLSARERHQYKSMSKIAPVETSHLLEKASFADDDSVIHELAEILEAQEPVPQRKRHPLKARRLPSSDKIRRTEGKGSILFLHEVKSPRPTLRVFANNQKPDLQKKRTLTLSLSKVLSPRAAGKRRIAIDAGSGKSYRSPY